MPCCPAALPPCCRVADERLSSADVAGAGAGADGRGRGRGSTGDGMVTFAQPSSPKPLSKTGSMRLPRGSGLRRIRGASSETESDTPEKVSRHAQVNI